MDSPAKGDRVKASQKHIEFQLQREKTYTRELEDKIKSQQAYVAKLEQDKAELRREKLTLADDEKKKSKLEERCHTLQRDLTEKQSMLLAEQKRITVLESEKEQIRRDAHASIAKWCEAEKQWIAENETLQSEIDESKGSFAKLTDEFEALRKHREDLQSQLKREKERSLRQESTVGSMEKQLASLHSRIEGLQNEIYTRDETIFKLDEAGAKWQEVCRSKDDETKSLEVQLTKQTETNERLQGTITLLNQRIEAAKTMNLEEKGHVERLSCDLADSQKEYKLLQLELETVRRDFERVTQNSSKQQDLLVELRNKVAASAEQVKEKNLEIRRLELSGSELTAEVKRLERDTAENSYLASSLENQIQKMRLSLNEAQSSIEVLQQEKAFLDAELLQVKASHEAKDETVVIMKSEYEDKIESLLSDIATLESEVNARQQMINSITKQLGDANKKSEEHYEKALADSDNLSHLHGELVTLKKDRCALLVDQVILKETGSRYELQGVYYEDALRLVMTQIFAVLMQYSREVTHLNASMNQINEEVSNLRQNLEMTSARYTEKMQNLEENEARLLEEIQARDDKLIRAEVISNEHSKSISQLQDELKKERILREEVMNELRLISEKYSETQKLVEESLSTTQTHSSSSQQIVSMCNEYTRALSCLHEICVSSFAAKTEVTLDYFHSTFTAGNRELQTALATCELSFQEMRGKCSSLNLKMREEAARFCTQEKIFLKQHESIATTLHTVEMQCKQIQGERDSLLQKYNLLKEQSGRHTAEAEEKIKVALGSVSDEKQRCGLLEEKIQKLKDTLEYETGRKREYKRALEEVKARREETERYRATEKDWALKAISRANDEVNYWVKSFDKLKYMLDDMSTKSGARVSTADQATINKFEEAKSRLVLRDHDINSVRQETVGEKRQRLEINK